MQILSAHSSFNNYNFFLLLFYVAQSHMELISKLRLATNSRQSSCLSLSRSGTQLYTHHTKFQPQFVKGLKGNCNLNLPLCCP